jgi:hypothetical protein
LRFCLARKPVPGSNRILIKFQILICQCFTQPVAWREGRSRRRKQRRIALPVYFNWSAGQIRKRNSGCRCRSALRRGWS